MANLFKKFGDYGLAGISGKIQRIEGDNVIANAHTWDKENKKYTLVSVSIDMKDQGGVLVWSPGRILPPLGSFRGKMKRAKF